MTNHCNWLNGPFLEDYETRMDSNHAGPGRPQTPFNELGDRAKRQKTQEMRKSFSPEEIKHAAKTTMYTEGERTSAALMDDMLSSPSKPLKIKKQLNIPAPKPYTEDEALAFLLDMKMTVPHYQQTRNGAIERNANIYPPYRNVLDAKKRCYPKNVTVDDFRAEVPLQDLMDHTGQRLIQAQEEVFHQIPEGPKELVLLSKWGFDSSTGQSVYNQVTTQNTEGVAEKSLFVVSVVPVKMYFKNNPNKIIWKNPTPSSTRFCRQKSFEYMKETDEVTRAKKNSIQLEIDNLQTTLCDLQTGRVEISHVLAFTMIDGKVCTAVTNTASAATCPTCGATPKLMNKLDAVLNRPINKESLLFGLSPMHLYIRSFEMIIHISIRLSLPKPTWQIRGVENKKIAQERKYELQRRFKKEWGLTIETPSSNGQGNSNCGNTGRTFFSNPAKAAALTGVNEELIENLGILLFVINSGYGIDVEKFDAFCIKTAKLYFMLYVWFYMPQSVHRLLIHGKRALEELVVLGLTIGESSEEPQETRNKEHKYSREHHTRKISRTKTNEDQMNYMMVTSDPVISTIRKPQTAKKNPLPMKALSLLESGCPSSPDSDDISEDESSSDESEYGSSTEDEENMEVDDMDTDLPNYYYAEE